MNATKLTLKKASLLMATMAIMAMLVAMSPASSASTGASANGVNKAQPEAVSEGTYIIVMKEAPLALYDGGLPNLAPTSLMATGEARLNAKSSASQAYLSYLAGRRQETIAAANQLLGRTLVVSYEYGATLVGFATTLNPAEAKLLTSLDSIAYVEKETISYPLTDSGPSWIGAPEIWGGPWSAIGYNAAISGANEVPAVTTNATATGSFEYNYYTNELSYQIDVTNPDAVNFTAMHIHNGAVGVNGPVIYNFGLTATSATSFHVAGTTTLSDADEGNLANGLLYVNAHSATNAGGEIRGQIELTGSLGEGVIVGVIDTGIDPWNPSFLATGDDGYTAINPLGAGNYLGVCDPTNTSPPSGVVAYDPSFPCNDKLIGAWGYTASDPSPRDGDGHGSHTASTSAGNFVMDSTITATVVFTANISGVAPHANVIAYDGCIDGGGCPGASLSAARDQAVLDGVDVINYSIGSGSPTGNPWSDAEAIQWLALRSAGIFVATSNGNAGPGAGTTGSPADLPWLMSVGASSHNRKFLNEVIVTDSNGANISLEGEGMAGGYGPAQIVWAADFGDNLCQNPFPGGTFSGQIVVCERGVNARVAKGQNVLAGGAGGMILAQPAEIGGGPGALASDPHVLPATHIDFYVYQDLLAFEAAAPGNVITGTLQGAYLAADDSYGDIMASFSSRGPNGSLVDVIVPSVTAPGRAIWAAYHQGPNGDGDYSYNVIQGTSMSSPHAAGAAALVVALHPDWTPAQVQSALMTTSLTTILNDDGQTPATPFAMGAGRIQVNLAAEAGFVLDVTTAEYQDANPATAGNPQSLNIASLGDGDCFGTCVWVREIESTMPVTTSWVITPELPAGMTMVVDPVAFELAPGATQVITFTADVSALATEEWFFGRVWFTETTPVPYPVVELSKSDSGITAAPGDSIDYTLSYTNTGDGDAMGVWITETVSAGTTFNAAASSAGWTEASAGTYTYYIGHLAPSESGSVQFVVDVNANTVVASIDNTAYITGEAMSVGQASDTTPVVIVDATPVIYLPFIQKAGAALAASQPRTVLMDMPAVGLSTTGLAPLAHFPLAVSSVSCAAPDLIEITAFATMGSEDHLICPQSLAVTDLDAALVGLTEGTVYTDSLSVDPTNGDAYDNINDGTVTAITVTVSNSARLVAEIVASEAPDMDLFVGTGDTPSAATQVCASTSGTAIEYCNIDNPADGTWWVLVQSWAASATPPDDVTFVVGVVPATDEGNWSVTGPNVASGEPLTATIGWNEPAFAIGDYWYGNFALGTSPATPGNLATVNVDVEVDGVPVIETDATDFASSQASGEVVTFTMAISNTGTSDLDWNITEDNDTLMRGVQGSLLYENGPFITAVGGGAGGADESAVTVGLANAGFGHAVSTGVRVSDQFTVTDAAGWTVTNFTFYAYQTNSPATSTITGINYNIWDGPPGVGGSAIIYTSAPNALSSTAWSNVYRVGAAGNGNTARPIMTSNASANVFLPQGTYWVDWQSDGSLASGPWTPPITIVGQTTTGDARQFTGGNWGDLLDSTFPQGLPFMVEGFVGGAALPCALTSPIAWASATPNSGTTAPGDATAVEVAFDSTGLSMGTYQGYLCVNSNDPVTPQISVPVSLTVTSAPILINLNLSEVTSTQNAGTTTNQDLEIGNTGGGTLLWDIDEVDGFLRPVAVADVVESVETVSFVPQAGFGLTGSGLSASAGLTALPAAQRVPNQTITHSTSQAITAGNSIACGAGGFHTDNSYWRAFDLPTFGINGAFTISSVDVGVETAAGGTGSQPVVLRLYAAPSGTAFPAAFPASFNLIATENVDVANQTLSLLNIPVAAVVPANSVLVMELFTPSGQAPLSNNFYVGSNAAGQSAPSYLSAAPCGIATPTDLAAIGFGNMHIVMNVTGEEAVPQVCDTPVDIPWLTLNPTSGSAGAGITNTVNVALDSTGLPAGVYTGTLCVNSNASNAPLVEVPVAMTVTVPTGSSIDMAMTVGTDSSVCAATDAITVTVGTEVTYCYEVTNTGAVTLTQHDLADTELGTVLNAFPYSLAPGASAFITESAVLTATTVSTATWTAYNPGPVDTATDSDSATVNMAAGNPTVTYCRNAVNIAIPDNTPAGVDDVLNVAENGTIVDVNFFVNATHTWNGDMIFTLTHNATPVILVDKPGTVSGAGCSGDNFPNMTLDDEATTPGTPVETSCTNTVPGYPANSSYTPNNPLSGFDSGNLNGTWTLNSRDTAGADTGTLVDWCVVIEYTP